MSISVIVPVYNAENSIARCVNSVLEQLDTDDEIILVDDGSTDQGGAICDALAADHPNITVIHQENRGALRTRRAGMQASRGQYLLFPDADDYLMPDAISQIKEAIATYHSDVILYDWYRVDAYTKAESVVRQLPDKDTDAVFAVEMQEVYEQIGRGNTAGVLNAKAVSRDLIDWDADYDVWGNRICVSNDLFQVLPILDKAVSCTYIAKPLYCYQKTVGSITLSYKPEKITSYAEVLKRREYYLQKWGVCEKNVDRSRIRSLNAVAVMIEGAYIKAKKQKDPAVFQVALDTVRKNEGLAHIYELLKTRGTALPKRMRLYYSLLYAGHDGGLRLAVRWFTRGQNA